MSDNVNDWDSQIQQILSSILPKDLGAKSTLHWQKVDDKKGYGIGSVVLSSKNGDSVGIPVIIKQWHMAPLDVVLRGNKAYPLNASSIEEIFSRQGVSDEAISRHDQNSSFNDNAGQNDVYPPVNGGRYVTASLLEEIAPTILKEDADRFRKVASDGAVLVSAHNSGTIELFNGLSKIAGKDEPNPKKLKKDIIQVRKQGHNSYGILGNPDGTYSPVMNSVDRPTMRRFVESIVGEGEAEKNFVSRVDKNREGMLVGPKNNIGDKRDSSVKTNLGQHGEVFLYDEHEHDFAPQKADAFGVYGVKDNAGVTSYGYVFPNVVTFDGKKSGVKIFAGPSLSSTKREIFGMPAPGREVNLPETQPEPGKMGTLIYVKGDKTLATEPFRVTTSIIHGTVHVVKAKDYRGNDIGITFSPTAKGITKIKDSPSLPTVKNVYVVPSEMRFLEMYPEKPIAQSANEHAKFASGSLSANPLDVSVSNGRYVFRAKNLEKYASVNDVEFDFNSLGKDDASFLLASFGCPLDKIAHILDREPGMACQVHGLTFPKVAADVESVSPLRGAVRSLRVDLVKEASTIDDADTVDVALSLGFINSENVSKFVMNIQKLKDTLSSLSKMLLASRLGMSDIPERPLMSSISGILKVIGGLKKLSLANDQVAP